MRNYLIQIFLVINFYIFKKLYDKISFIILIMLIREGILRRAINAIYVKMKNQKSGDNCTYVTMSGGNLKAYINSVNDKTEMNEYEI